MLLFTALFGGLMLLSIESRRRMIAVLLIGCIAAHGVTVTEEGKARMRERLADKTRRRGTGTRAA